MSITGTLILAFIVFLPVFVQSPPVTSDKKGISVTQWDYAPDAKILGVSWAYTWGPTMTLVDGIEIVPMINNMSTIGKTIGGNSRWIMGFNEPDLADITPGMAAMAWRAIDASHPDELLLSPAPSHLHPEWLAQFRDVYIEQYDNPPRLDAIASHCYLPTAEACRLYVTGVISQSLEWGISQVWVTEFAFPGKSDEMEAFVWWMENEPMIARYAIYTAEELEGYRQGFALIEDGRLNEMGMAYRSLP